MFPNVRLLIGALFITVLVLSCEFGVFAALRVNREPLSRLTSESAPLQLVAGKNAPPAMPISWNAAGGTQTGAIAAEVPVSQPAVRVIEVPAPSNDDATGTLDNDNQANPAVLQTALAPAAPAPNGAPVADAAAPIAQPPMLPPANSAPSGNAAALANPAAGGAPANEVSGPAVGAAVDKDPEDQAAAAPAALAAVPAQHISAAEIVKPAESLPVQAAPAAQPHETAAQAGEPPAGSAQVIAAIAPVAAQPVAAEPAEITGSVPNAAMPESAAPKAEAPQSKPSPKIVHKRAAKKPHKTARAPTPPHHAVKKRIVRKGPAPAPASWAQPATDFNNPVFQSAPGFQQPAKSRPGAKNAATNNGFNTFGTQFGTQ